MMSAYMAIDQRKVPDTFNLFNLLVISISPLPSHGEQNHATLLHHLNLFIFTAISALLA